MCDQAWRELWEALRGIEKTDQMMRERLRQSEPRTFEKVEEDESEEPG